mmetsp:Transcript_13019/g.22283  ORF Transcript_13019/g.22283 Transcript_13019/m.22283 type:complete len:163 (-) Transcript_13019:258-746(-)
MRFSVAALVVLCAPTAALMCTPRAHIGRSPSTARSAGASMGLVRQVNTAEFEAEIQDCETPILVDVYAVWCGPCQLMAPQLEEVAKKLEGRCRVLKIDSDEEPEVSSTLQIRGLPTVMLIKDMAIVMRAEGALMADELMQLVEHHAFDGPEPVIGDADSVTV